MCDFRIWGVFICRRFSLDSILPTMRQNKLDKEMLELGRQRYHNRKEKASKLASESNTIPGRMMLNRCTTELAAEIQAWIAKASAGPGKRHRCLPFITQLDAEKVAVIASKIVIDALSQDRMLTGTCIAVGRAIEDEILLQDLADNNPDFLKTIQKKTFKSVGQKFKRRFAREAAKAVDLVTKRWAKADALAVGLLCIELLAARTNIVEIITKLNARGRRYCIIQPSKDIKKWIKDCHEYHETLEPMFLPTIEKPLEWNNPWVGGYSSLDWKPRPLVKSRSKAYQQSLSSSLSPAVYDAVNFVQNTPWVVDQETMQLVRECWKEGLAIDSLPPSVDEALPTKPVDIDTNQEARRNWRKAAAKVHFLNESYESQRLLTLKSLFVAEKMSEFPRLWFPHQLDFRGRGYPLPLFLHPQGVSYAKAMLRFADGKAISTDSEIFPLYVHVANKFGRDKDSLQDRVRWVEENRRSIEQIANDPWSNRLWLEADEPFAFVAACREICGLWREGKGFTSSLPIAMDATTQGLQIYSMLRRDPVAAVATNVLPSDKPSDPYQFVANSVITRLQQSDDPLAKTLLRFGIDRTTTKRQTMTLPYGLTMHSCITYTREWLEDKMRKTGENPFGLETYKPVATLGKIIWESIDDVVGSAKRGMDFIRGCMAVLIDNDVTPYWITPIGFPVRMRYENYDVVTVSTRIGAKAKVLSIRQENGTQSKRKALNGGPANYVHSMDGFGGLLGHTINLCAANKINHMGCVHDQILCLAGDYMMAASCVRRATVDIFSRDLLREFREGALTMLPSSASMPEVPEYGSLDIAKVLDSDYYFN
jgi:DNA-directed RNA polymerase